MEKVDAHVHVFDRVSEAFPREESSLAPAGRADKLAEAMQRMLTDAQLRNRLTAAARKHVVREFDNMILVKDLAEVYREHVGRGQMSADRWQRTEGSRE